MYKNFSLSIALLFLGACSVNPATGDRQFTAFLPAAQEASLGAQEHEKILASSGGAVENAKLTSYVRSVGEKIVPYTERAEVDYTFTVLDSSIVNAFALPGGYVYVTRGLLALASNEDELAAVIAHEIGHVTARHSAERYSQGVLAGLGTTIFSAAVNDAGLSRAAGFGTDLYLKSYSRGQETQADDLGIRYLSRAGYNPHAMAAFLQKLKSHEVLQNSLNAGANARPPEFLSTHPATETRVAEASETARAYSSPQGDYQKTVKYMQAIEGMSFGESAKQGFVRNNLFVHPQLKFAFAVPDNFKIANQTSQIVGQGPDKTGFIFDGGNDKETDDPFVYLTTRWAPNQNIQKAESVTVNGLSGATGYIVKGNTIHRLMAVRFGQNLFYRFHIQYPVNTSGEVVRDLQAMTYSFKILSDSDLKRYQPSHITIKAASAGMSVSDMVARMDSDLEAREGWFRLMNGLSPREGLVSGRLYKLIVK